MGINPERLGGQDRFEGSARLIRGRAYEAGFTLKFDLAADLPDIMVDAQRMKRVLLNLFTNAVEFTPKGGEIVVRVYVNDANEFVVAVMDTGLGMSPDEIATALQHFGPVDSQLSRKFDGTGLGFPLTNSFVELHGGRVAIESQPKSGTTALFLLTVRAAVGLAYYEAPKLNG